MTTATNWREYERCPTCRRVTGERCRDTSRAQLVLLDAPHPERSKRRPLAPGPLLIHDMRLPCYCSEALGQSCRACR